MSHIPSSAMPHAGGGNNQESGNGAPARQGRARAVADKARDNPKTAIAGAALVAGAIAAAAIPMVRARARDRAAGA